MKINLFLGLFACLFFSVSAAAQQKFYEEAAIFLTNGDTLRGFIEHESEVNLAEIVHFKKKKTDATATNYSPNDLKGFSFANSPLVFKSIEWTKRVGTSKTVYNRFAKKMLSGYVSLYRLLLPYSAKLLKDNEALDRAYILEKSKEYFTLDMAEYINDNKYTLAKRYQGMLQYAFNDCSTMAKEIPQVLFTDESITQIVKKYNECRSPNQKTVELQHKIKTAIEESAEIMFTTIVFPKNEVTNAQGFSIGYAQDRRKADESRRLSFNIGINYLFLRYNTKDYLYGHAYDVTKTEHYIRVPISTRFNMGSDNINPFLYIGLTPQISTDAKFSYIDVLPFIHIGAGIRLHDWYFAAQMEKTSFSFYTLESLLNLKIGYIFKKR